MQIPLINTFDCLAISIFLYLLVNFRNRRRRAGLFYPPGPPPWPIIANLLDIPKDTTWSAYADMSKKYGRRSILGDTDSPQLKPAFKGDIVYLSVYSQAIVVVCSFSAIKDLFEKRGQIYSIKHPLPIFEMYALKCYNSICRHFDNTRSLGRKWIGQYS